MSYYEVSAITGQNVKSTIKDFMISVYYNDKNKFRNN